MFAQKTADQPRADVGGRARTAGDDDIERLAFVKRICCLGLALGKNDKDNQSKLRHAQCNIQLSIMTCS